MPKTSRLPKPLPPEISRPLLAVTDRIFRLAPWTFMADLHLVGVRDEATGELRVASVMGARSEVFAVAFYRRAPGLNWIHQMATEDDQPVGDPAFLDGMDFVKVEWTTKKELDSPDLETLAAAGYKPAGRGHVWPRFQSATPGWVPWFASEAEAAQLTADLTKVARFAELFATEPELWDDRPRGVVAVVPAGDGSLRREEVEWLPLVPPGLPKPEPVALTQTDLAKLMGLPQRTELVFELTAQLVPEMAFMVEPVARPCIARVALMSDQRSYYVFASELVGGHEPLRSAVEKAFVKGLLAARVRPGRLLVDSATLEAVLTPACTALQIPIKFSAVLVAAHDAMDSMIGRLGQTVPH